jgi:hypothetical protein
MGLKYEKIIKNPAQILSLTGFMAREFDVLAEEFKKDWDEHIACYTLEGKPRQRISLPRRTSVLARAHDKLFFILVYLKAFPLQELDAASFDMVQPQANKWIHLLAGVLRKTLKRLGTLPERNAEKLEWLLQGCSDILLDGSERPVQRPKDDEMQKECYSGKKNA